MLPTIGDSCTVPRCVDMSEYVGIMITIQLFILIDHMRVGQTIQAKSRILANFARHVSHRLSQSVQTTDHFCAVHKRRVCGNGSYLVVHVGTNTLKHVIQGNIPNMKLQTMCICL